MEGEKRTLGRGRGGGQHTDGNKSAGGVRIGGTGKFPGGRMTPG